MKKNFALFNVIAAAVIMFSSCKDKSALVINGTILHPGSQKKVVLMAVDSSQVAVVDSANLNEQNKFVFKHAAPYASLFMLRIGNSIYDVIGKNGDEIDFTADLSDKQGNYDVKGSPETEKIKEFDKIRNAFIIQRTKLAEEYDSVAQSYGKSTDSLVNIYRPKYQKNMTDLAQASIKFANDNASSIAGFYAIAMLEDPTQYEQQVIAYVNKIRGNFPDNAAVQGYIRQVDKLIPVSIGHKAPDFTITGIDGKPIKLSDYKGKYVMLDFWASWCVPCRQENPNVVKQYTKFHPMGLNILGISLDQDKAKWQQAINADKLVWNHASDLKNFEGATERLYHVEGIPSNFIINPDGIIVAKNVRGTDLEDFLNKTFNKSQQNVKIK
ncbi:MAG: redoxin domain-containing protein [Mucilaginibacter sp.]